MAETPSSSTATAAAEKHIILGCGMVSADYVAVVDAFPQPDEKIRSRSLQVLGGGNAGNALTCAVRLGLTCRLISKVAEDNLGRSILAELHADGVDTSYFTVSKKGTSTSSYVIVDKQKKTRTCICTPGFPAMLPDDLPRSRLLSAMDGAKLVYLDCNLHRIALLVAQEAARMNIPIVIDAERKKPELDHLLSLASYVICAEKFPQAWTSAPSIASALVSITLRFPRTKFVIVTLGSNGCIMLERCSKGEDRKLKELDVELVLESLKQRVDENNTAPICLSSDEVCMSAKGVGTVRGRLLLGTAESIPISELVDTTGAGDAFVGAALYGLCAGMPPEKMLPFASQVAATACRSIGARTGLPRLIDQRLVPFLN